ncbi:testis-specific serine/threonine-protein kinase 1-like [Ranitomeya imitator]|uniref:testis-specific serine/threonine-protein kinase 1-like n=2 Tax=Ranitomeya imitator TaxID=111125 RepID=UPI0037E82224
MPQVLMDDSAVLKRKGYTVGIILGQGSYAKVRAAFSEHLKCCVAVKVIDRNKAPPDFLQKFLPREMEIVTVMNHHSIVKTYEIFETSAGKVYIVMELGAQGDLLEFIKNRGPMPEDVARKLFHQLASAVKYCHDLDIVHRDLKCENILLDKEFNIKLSDFGFARRIDDNHKPVLSKTFCGSAAYAAPEVLQGIPYEPKVYDIWSLGVILFIMVAGSMPYDDSNIKKMLRVQKEQHINFPSSKHFSSECKDIIYRMLQPNVRQRITVDEILNHKWLQPIAKAKESGNTLLNKKVVKPADQTAVFKQDSKNPDKASDDSLTITTVYGVANVQESLVQEDKDRMSSDTSTSDESINTSA